jgi:hypothetical protein
MVAVLVIQTPELKHLVLHTPEAVVVELDLEE